MFNKLHDTSFLLNPFLIIFFAILGIFYEKYSYYSNRKYLKVISYDFYSPRNIVNDYRDFKKITKVKFTKFIQNNTDYYNPYIFDNIQHYPNKTEWKQQIDQYLVRHFIAKDVYIHPEMVLYWDNLIFLNRSSCQANFTLASTKPIVFHLSPKSYDLVISLHHQSGALFGHFVTDILPKFALLPEKYLKEAYFMVNYDRNKRLFLDQFYDIMRIPPDHLIMEREIVYAKKAIIIESGECTSPNPFVLNMFRKMCIKHFSLSTDPPDKYVIYNRNFGRTRLYRRLLNIEDLLMIVHRYKQLSTYHFILYDDSNGLSVLKQAQFYSTIKLLFAVDGAGLGNTLFMQDHTALIEIFISTIKNYIGFFLLSMSNCRVFIGYRDIHIQLIKNSPNVFSASNFIQLLTLAIEKLEDKDLQKTDFVYETQRWEVTNESN